MLFNNNSIFTLKKHSNIDSDRWCTNDSYYALAPLALCSPEQMPNLPIYKAGLEVYKLSVWILNTIVMIILNYWWNKFEIMWYIYWLFYSSNNRKESKYMINFIIYRVANYNDLYMFYFLHTEYGRWHVYNSHIKC